jgi:hypothetical protein
MQQQINTLPNVEKMTPGEISPFNMGARIYRGGEKIIEGVITKVTSHGAYVWQTKEKYPQDSAEWFPFYCDKISWSVFGVRK